MNVKIFFVVGILATILGCISPSTSKNEALILNSDILSSIEESVFEVVIPKPSHDPLSYAEPLPLDLIPFKERNDEFESIGTAFAISNKLLLSAAHLFDLEYDNEVDEMFIRDRGGKVYKIDSIHSYSNDVDFVSFSAEGFNVSKVLNINEDFQLNEKVFTVGNALGDGVVIREGTLTSTTKEDEEGQWEWLRFSAPASPGNSGGPLLDKDGNVIGLITMASEKENLNYAIPMDVVNKKTTSVASLHQSLSYAIPITYQQKRVTYEYETSLPKRYSDIKKELVDNYQGFLDKTLSTLISEEKQYIFPNTPGSLDVLYTIYQSIFPSLIYESDAEAGGVYEPSEVNEAFLEHNGRVQYGDMSDITYVYLEKPENTTLKTIYESPRLLMELALKGCPFYREIMDKEVRITSLGDPVEGFEYSDSYKRKWLISIWQIDFDRSKIIAFSLPVPTGTINLICRQYGGSWPYTINDIKLTTNYIYITYSGKFENWEEFLKLKEYHPEAFRNIRFSYQSDEYASFSSDRLKLQYTNELFDISSESVLALYFTYFKENDEVIWDIGEVSIGEHAFNENYFSAIRVPRSDDNLRDYYHWEWSNLCGQKYPYDQTPYYDNGSTVVESIHSQYSHLRNEDVRHINDNFVYSLRLNVEGKVEDGLMKSAVKLVDSAFKILEN